MDRRSRYSGRSSCALESHVAQLQASVATIAHEERPEYLDRLSMLRNQVIEILRAFLMRDGGDGGLQLRDVRLQRDGHSVPEAALHARADGAEKPRRGGRDT